MGFQEAVRTCLGKYSDFSGRARRSEFWFWSLALLVLYIVGLIVAFILSAIAKPLGILAFLVLGLAYLGAIVPSLAVTWRRLHDTGRSGAWWLIGLIPFVGPIVLLVFNVQDSQPGDNQYGPNPKGLGGLPGGGYGAPGYGQPAPGYGPPAPGYGPPAPGQ